jgi:hypothetical protein
MTREIILPIKCGTVRSIEKVVVLVLWVESALWFVLSVIYAHWFRYPYDSSFLGVVAILGIFPNIFCICFIVSWLFVLFVERLPRIVCVDDEVKP